MRAVDETDLLSDLGSALPDTRTERDTVQTLAGDDLAALFGLDMAQDQTPDSVRSATTKSGAPFKKVGKRVVAKTTAAVVPMVESKAEAAKPAQKRNIRSVTQSKLPWAKVSAEANASKASKKDTMPSIQPASRKTSGKAATTNTSAGLREAPAIATASARRQSDTLSMIAATVPVSRLRQPSSTKSAAAKLAGSRPRK